MKRVRSSRAFEGTSDSSGDLNQLVCDSVKRLRRYWKIEHLIYSMLLMEPSDPPLILLLHPWAFCPPIALVIKKLAGGFLFPGQLPRGLIYSTNSKRSQSLSGL